MKKVIRKGVFETNSSSTHSITICSKEDYDKWEAGELLLDNGWKPKKQFITKQEAIEKLKTSEYYNNLDINNEDEVEEALADSDLITSDHYWNTELETFKKTYKTKSGEEVVAFGKYGYDG